MSYTYDYVNKMDLEDIILTYELLLEQDFEQSQEYEKALR